MNDEATLAGAGPAGDGEEVDVLFLAGQQPSLAGEWLLVTEADGKPGGTGQRVGEYPACRPG